VEGAVKEAKLGERASKLRLPEMRPPSPGGQPVADEDARLERLERLAKLHEQGVLSDEEFALEKSRVLGNGELP
jgi:Short C-terminal domain